MTTYKIELSDAINLSAAVRHVLDATRAAGCAFHALGERAGARMVVADSFLDEDGTVLCFRCLWERGSTREKRAAWANLQDVLNHPSYWVAEQIRLGNPPEFLEHNGAPTDGQVEAQDWQQADAAQAQAQG